MESEKDNQKNNDLGHRKQVDFEELKKAAEPLQHLLNENYNLMCVAIVEIGGVRIYSTEIGTPSENILD